MKIEPYEIAKEIMVECVNYPKAITVIAERVCRLHANENLKAIGEIAKNEHWFENQAEGSILKNN